VKSEKDGGWWPEAAEEDLPVYLTKPRRASAIVNKTADVVTAPAAGVASGQHDKESGYTTGDRVLPAFAAFARLAKAKLLDGQKVQHYGNSTDINDLTDHFVTGTNLGAGGAKSKKEMYGGNMGHDGKDTHSHMDLVSLAPGESGAILDRVHYGGVRKGADKHDRDTVSTTATGLAAGESTDLMNGSNVVAPHYGNGHEHKDTFSHFKDGMNLGDAGMMNSKDMYGGGYGGENQNEDTRSHLGVGFIPRPASPPKRWELPTIGPEKQYRISYRGYMEYSQLKENKDSLVVDPEKVDGARAKMVFPGKLVSRPETIDAAEHDNRYYKYSANVEAAEYDATTHTTRKNDGFAVHYPGYRAAPKSVSTVEKSDYMQKWRRRQQEGLGDLRGGRFHQGQGGKSKSTKDLLG